MMVAKRPRNGGKAAMIQASLGHHPGKTWMMVANRSRDGGFAAMIIILKNAILIINNIVLYLL
jgi:hypothetical protein